MNSIDFLEIQLYLAVVCIVYRFGLKHTTFFTFNRYFLVIGSLAAIGLAFLPAPEQVTHAAAVILPEFTLGLKQNTRAIINSEYHPVINYLSLCYTIICLLFLLVAITSLMKILRGKWVRKDEQTYLISQHQAAPFSWFNIIVVNQLPLPTAIKDHEQAHIKQRHFIDLTILQLIAWLNWLNPFAWFLLRAAKENHELLADQYALNKGTSTLDYKRLMLSQVLNTTVPVFSHTFFNQSIIKTRMKMMTQNQSNKSRLVIALLTLPLFAIIFLACNNDKAENTAEPVVTKAEVMPEFKGGTEALYSYLGQNIVYPEAAKVDSIEGVVFVSFIVDKTGVVTQPEVLKGIDPRLDAVALKVISDMPEWTPGMDKGKPVAVQYNIPIRFKLQ